ncbi:bacterial transcription activator, effector binding domain protein [Asticcacaulis biprosthecium C19]|uniref:Bacterial transcription activator, effector binding domain protein n=1 Tax=Asticcacaulis biprosthecium C19 TaxID=715226 RepID=F4QQF3_9CAUL|nr:GyrI-like domain-containing protein [Asticcacaulis biprosthecium]EGF90440.1 bacterial transcription activator, effector binding domain protein [Asticcacaulis biprosthecium C19]
MATEPYRLETAPERKLTGLSGHYDMTTNSQIPALWDRFNTFELPERPDPEVYYGVCYNNSDSGFDYLCGVEIADDLELPAEFNVLDIAAQTYAVFTHTGHISGIGHTWGQVWQQHVPQFGLKVLPAPFYERYGPDFDPESGNGEVTIWIPVAG